MEGAIFAIGIVAAELTLVAVLTWVVILLRDAKAPDAKSQLAKLEREEEELKKAA